MRENRTCAPSARKFLNLLKLIHTIPAMGVTIRQRKDKSDDVWWVFVNHLNRRTSLKVGSKRAAVQLQRELQVMLALDRAIHDLNPRNRGRLKPDTLRQAEDLRRRLKKLLDELEWLLERNRQDQIK